jgi:predicted branched-subunit amino acid permease
MIVLTTFVVNLRHLLYATTLVPYVKHLTQNWKIPLAFWLTDEAFAVAINRYHQTDNSPYKQWYFLGSAMFMYLNWQFCTLLGLTLGQMIPNMATWGLDFAMPVTFIGMVMPYLKNKPMWATVIVAGGVALLTFTLPHKLGLMLAALAGIGAGMITESVEQRMG